MSPAKIPIRLMTTCTSVNVVTDIPKIMTASFRIEDFISWNELATKKLRIWFGLGTDNAGPAKRATNASNQRWPN
jgi:hypothetical protein